MVVCVSILKTVVPETGDVVGVSAGRQTSSGGSFGGLRKTWVKTGGTEVSVKDI